jgi:hypothetical protein
MSRGINSLEMMYNLYNIFLYLKGKLDKIPLFLIMDDYVNGKTLYENENQEHDDGSDEAHVSKFYRSIYQEFLDSLENTR